MPRWPKRQPIGDPDDPRGFEALLASYLEWRDVHNYSQRARGTCESSTRDFCRWCGERGILRPVDVTRSVVERYQRWLHHHRRDDGRPLAVATQSSRLSYVRSFFRWLVQQRYMLHNPTLGVELPKCPPRLPVDGFSVEEAEQILSVPDVETPLGLRDRAVLETLYSTGIRRMELAQLDLYDIDFERGWLTVRRGKGGKDRVVPIGERAMVWLGLYLERVRPALQPRAEEWGLFLNAEGRRFTPDGLGNRVAKLIARSGVRHRVGACHLFRHTMATSMLENGADVRYLQTMLGHAKLTTTEIYTRVSIKKLKQVHDATHPARWPEREEAAGDDAVAEEASCATPRRIRVWCPRGTRS